MNSEKLNELSKNIHSPVPFWFLNGQVEEWHIVREFEMMREKGIGGGDRAPALWAAGRISLRGMVHHIRVVRSRSQKARDARVDI